jgi:predicted nucleic acid-binding protein
MSVISNTTVISNFASIGQLDVLRQLYGSLAISILWHPSHHAPTSETRLVATLPLDLTMDANAFEVSNLTGEMAGRVVLRRHL